MVQTKKQKVIKYLHHFLGCDIMIVKSGGSMYPCGITKLTSDVLNDFHDYTNMAIMPILHEAKENVLLKESEQQGLVCDLDSFHFLCEKGYDIFGLADENLALRPQKELINIYTQKGLWHFSDLSDSDKKSTISEWLINQEKEASVISDVYALDIKSTPDFFAWLGALVTYNSVDSAHSHLVVEVS